MTATAYYRLGIAVALATVLFLILGIGALGIIGAGGEPDRMYAGVLVVGVVGAVVSRLRARGMALTLLAMAVAMGLVAVIAFVAGYQHNEGASVVDILGLTGMFAGLFCVSAWLFWRAAELQATVAVGGRV